MASRPVGHRILVAAARVLIRALSLLPLGAVRWLARRAGTIAALLGGRSVVTTDTNLAVCFPALSSAERGRLRARSLQQTACLLLESGVTWHWSQTRWQRLIVANDGEEALREARETGRGVLVMVPHFGNWEFLNLFYGRFYALTALYDSPRIAAFDQPIRRARERCGSRLLPISRAGLRDIYATLSGGGVAGLLPDQVPEADAGVYAPFYGRPALTMTFGHRLIQRTRPLVVIASAQRVPGGFHLRTEVADRDLYDPQPAVYAAGLNRHIERVVNRDPAQYQWEYKRFKRSPVGWQSPYARISNRSAAPE